MAISPAEELELRAFLAERAAATADAADRALDRRALRNGEATLTAQERARLAAARTRWAGETQLDQPTRAARLVVPVNSYAQLLNGETVAPARVMNDALDDVERRVAAGENVPARWLDQVAARREARGKTEPEG
jgi:hypothetical protein